jgi:spore maturation protein CgeB
MGSGAVLAIASSAENDQPEGMNSLFEPHCHYIPFTKESFPDVVKRYCSNERERRRIGEQASELVHQKHTWRHRAEKILGDIRQCR